MQLQINLILCRNDLLFNYYKLVVISCADKVKCTKMQSLVSYRASSYDSVVLAVIILSVCLSHVCIVKAKQCTADILIPHEMAITLVFCGWWVTPPFI